MRRIGFAVLGLSLAGFSLWGSAADGQVPAANKAVLGAWGVDLSGMDRNVKPGDDFFRYVNGAWFDTAEIPPDRTTTGSFVQLDIQSETRIRSIPPSSKPAARISRRKRSRFATSMRPTSTPTGWSAWGSNPRDGISPPSPA